jgi:hypothetical protein
MVELFVKIEFMENVYRKFYRNFYIRTGGFIPTKPLNQNIYPGDFFQIRNGEMIVLGNIFRNGIVDPEECRFRYGNKLNPVGWSFGEGVTKPYSGRGSGHGSIAGEFEFSKQILAFADFGCFFFKGNDPESVKILNWGDLQQQLIIKLTQTYYSFREAYVVTESASASDWTLAVASSDKGELEIATDSENFGLVDIFGHHSARTIQSKDIEFYHREPNRRPGFFKARKLVVQDEKLEVFISELINQRLGQDEWAGGFYDYDFHYDTVFTSQIPGNMQASMLDMLQANQLNPNTALLYFRWADMNLDDLEKLFLDYGH